MQKIADTLKRWSVEALKRPDLFTAALATGERNLTRHRAAARAALDLSRQRLGVRLPYAAFVAAGRMRCSVSWPHAALF
jgi:hypothetical protein